MWYTIVCQDTTAVAGCDFRRKHDGIEINIQVWMVFEKNTEEIPSLSLVPKEIM